MENFLIILNVFLAVLLVLVILLQKSEGGALGLGASQEHYMSSRSMGTALTKLTAVLATLFIITSISLTIISNKQLSTQSIFEKIEQKQESSEPTIPE
jgi:preprotein translocase subunit SecG